MSKPNPDDISGVLDIDDRRRGTLRDPGRDLRPLRAGVSVPRQLIDRYGLQRGLEIQGRCAGGSRGRRNELTELVSVNGGPPGAYAERTPFAKLTTIDPAERLVMETTPDRITTRVVDLMTPVGKGQRGLIVSPPRSGKTVLLQHMADALVKNHPEMFLIMLLVDERPEELTEMRRTVLGRVIGSSNDEPSERHLRTAELALEMAKRRVEYGEDVVILWDSLTRVARAYNRHTGSSGRTLSGGLDSRALEMPKRLFGTARNTEEAGSLTILATALVETDSRMDDVIFEEFKGTGNMELVLDRKLADRRIYPAFNLSLSGTRKEERLIPPEDLARIARIRRQLMDMKPVEQMETFLSGLSRFRTNRELLDAL